MNETNCPDDVRESIDNYVRDGVPPGDFVQAVLKNNLAMAFGRADDNNREALGDIVAYVWSDVPANLWGSREAVQAHIRSKLSERAVFAK